MISLSAGNHNVSINPVGARPVQSGRMVGLSVVPFLDDYEIRVKAHNLANEAQQPNAKAMLAMTATVGDRMVDRCIGVHNDEHRGSTASTSTFYDEMVQSMLVENERIIVDKYKKRAVLPFKSAKVVSKLGDDMRSFSFQGMVVTTNLRVIIVAANPSQGGGISKGVVIPRPTCLDNCGQLLSCGMYDAKIGERRYVLNYNVSENMVFWSAPLKDFKSGFELRISQGVEITNSIHSHLSCCDRMMGALCCGSLRQYQLTNMEAVHTTNSRTLSFPFLCPPWEDQATLILNLPTFSDATLGGDNVTNSAIQDFLEQFQRAAKDAGASIV